MQDPAPPDKTPVPLDAGQVEPAPQPPPSEYAPADWDEDLYQATCAMLVEPALASNPSLCKWSSKARRSPSGLNH